MQTETVAKAIEAVSSDSNKLDIALKVRFFLFYLSEHASFFQRQVLRMVIGHLDKYIDRLHGN